MYDTLFKRKDGFWEPGYWLSRTWGKVKCIYPHLKHYHPSGEADFY